MALDFRAQTMLQAVAEIAPKSEQLDRAVLLDAYVNMGHAEKCLTPTHQYIDGRRGTGKTHLFGFLAESVNATVRTQAHCAVYIDMRTLLLESGDRPGPKVEARRVFQELILGIADRLREVAAKELWQNDVPTARTAWEKKVAEQSHAAIDTLFRAAINGVHRPVKRGESRTEQVDETEKEAGASASAEVGTGGLDAQSVRLGGVAKWLKKATTRTEEVKSSARAVSYSQIRQAIESFLEVNDLERLYLLVDEWAFISLDAQPYLADLFRRTFLPSRRIAVKIATLPFQTRFAVTEKKLTVGFERNGDIYPAIDLDADLVFQRNPERSDRVLSAVLHQHLSLAFRKVGGKEEDFPKTADATIDALLTPNAQVRLLKFSHGNPRDYLTLFRKAYINWREARSDRITVDHVTSAARDFGAEKLESLKEHQPGSELFRGVIKEILHGKHKAVFMVREKLAESVPLQFLIHNRVLHVYDRSYSSPSYPGERFVVVAIDYCVLVDHLHAPNYRHILQAPDVALETAMASGKKKGEAIGNWVKLLLDLQDPDRRSIRNTVLPDSYLEETANAGTCGACGQLVNGRHPVTRKLGVCHHCGEPLAATAGVA